MWIALTKKKYSTYWLQGQIEDQKGEQPVVHRNMENNQRRKDATWQKV